MRHALYTTLDADRPDAICDRNGEVVLAKCRVCGGAEAALPTDCPGEHMTGPMLDAIQAGTSDFRGGKWVALTPAAVVKKDLTR